MTGRIDPKLTTAIRQRKRQDGIVHAAFTLGGGLLTPEATDKAVKELVARASKASAKAASKVVVFKNLQSFAIEAPATLVEKLTAEDAISTAALGS